MDEAAINKFEEYERKWCLDKEEPCLIEDPAELCKLVNKAMNFGNKINLTTVQEKFEESKKELIEITNEMKKNCDFDTIVRINRVLEMIYYACNTYVSLMRMTEVMNQITDYRDNTDINLFRFKAIDLNENTKYQNFLLYLLECFYRKGYGRYNGNVYSKIVIKEGEMYYNTKAWKYVGNIHDMIYNLVTKETNYDQFLNMTGNFGCVKSATEYLTYCNDQQFEQLNKDRHVYSFQNGIYDCEKDEFYKYEEENMDKGVCSSKYFPLKFEIKEDWRNIKTPYFDSIFQYQEIEEEVLEWVYVLTGRLIYEIGEKDGWQVILFVQGQAGTGKSTYANYICKELYDEEDVGVMSNNIQPKFGLSDLVDKMMWVAPEIKRDFSIEQGEFQSIITGEKVTVNVKHQKSRFEIWKSPGVLAGNECPDFIDNAGSIQRRLVPIRFMKKVKKGDLLLGTKVKKEMANIIQKCNKAYIEYSNKYGHEDIWGVLPEYFKETQKELACSTNALISFLNSEQIVIDPKKYIPEKIFVDMFNDHCKTNNYAKHRFNADFYMGPFSQFDIKVKRNTRKLYNGRQQTCTFLFGVDAADFDKMRDDDTDINADL